MDESENTAKERAAGAKEAARRILEAVRGLYEIDGINGCMHVISLLCDNSQDAELGEAVAPNVHTLGRSVLRTSIMRQATQAPVQVFVLPPGDGEGDDDDEAAPPRNRVH